MADKNKLAVVSQAGLPALRPAEVPQPSLPSLPASSGAWLGRRTTIMRKDTEFVRQHGEYLQARTAQSVAMRELVDSRISLATTIAKLGALREIIEHEYLKGRADRAYEMRMLDLTHQTDIVHAEARLLQTRQYLAGLQPEPPATPAPVAPAGLTPSDVEQIAQQLPELKPETVRTLSMMLAGLLAEKAEKNK